MTSFCGIMMSLVRTQVQFTEEQWHTLRRLSAQRGKSMAELVRQSVEHEIKHASGLGSLLAAAGKFSSGRGNVSVDHDRYLAEDFD